MWRFLPWLAALAVVIGYGLASLPNGFVYDDTQVILEQEAPSSLGDVAHYFAEEHFPGLSYYRPVTRSTLLVQKALHGDNPKAFHLFNAALAGLVLLLVYALLRLPTFAVRRVPALLAAMLFALHPLASSCVYPAASGRETMLPVLLSLAALYAFLRDGRRWVAAAVATFALALFAKEQAVVLPPLFALAEVLRLAEREATAAGSRRRWVRWAGLAATVAGYFTVRQFLFAGAEFRWSVFSEPLGPVVSLLFGVQSTVAPFAALHYEPPLAVWLSLPRLLLALAVVIGLLFAAFRLRLRLRDRDSPSLAHRPDLGAVAIFCAAWFVLTQLPTANVLVQEAKFSERYVLLGAFGAFALAAAVISRLWSQAGVRRWATVVGLVLVLLSAGVSFHRAVYFRDDLAFARQWAATNTESAIAQMGVASALVRSGSSEAALESFERAIRLDPKYADAYFNLGNTLADLGRPGLAADAYSMAIEQRPELVQASVNLGRLLRREGRAAEALVVYRRALEASAESYELRLGLAHALADLGRGDEAAAEYQRVLEANPDSAEAYYALGTHQLATGRVVLATESLERALEIEPERGEAHVNLGAALAQTGRYDEALQHYAEGVRLRPDDPAAQLSYGVLLLVLERPAEALPLLELGVRLEPAEPRGHFLLGQALEQLGRSQQAAAAYRRALELVPDFTEAAGALERLTTRD